MGTFNFEALYESLKAGVESTAKETVHQYLDQAKADGYKAVDAMKDSLQRWTQELENQQLTLDELGFLVEEEKDLNEMIALKQAGMAEVQIDTFKNSLYNMVLGTVLNFVKI